MKHFFKVHSLLKLLLRDLKKKYYYTKLRLGAAEWGSEQKIRIPFIRETSSGIQGSQEQVLSRVQFN